MPTPRPSSAAAPAAGGRPLPKPAAQRVCVARVYGIRRGAVRRGARVLAGPVATLAIAAARRRKIRSALPSEEAVSRVTAASKEEVSDEHRNKTRSTHDSM